jgi:cell division protein FtsL
MKPVKPSSVKQAQPSLLKALLLDCFVNYRVIVLLVIMACWSAMLLIYKSHDSRRLTAKLEALKQEQHQQKFNSDTLNLELTSLTESHRISSLAKKKLGMVGVNKSNEKVVSL